MARSQEAHVTGADRIRVGAAMCDPDKKPNVGFISEHAHFPSRTRLQHCDLHARPSSGTCPCNRAGWSMRLSSVLPGRLSRARSQHQGRTDPARSTGDRGRTGGAMRRMEEDSWSLLATNKLRPRVRSVPQSVQSSPRSATGAPAESWRSNTQRNALGAGRDHPGVATRRRGERRGPGED